MTSPENFNRVRAAFMRRAAAPNIPPHALKLAYVLCFKYMNRETRTARPAQETLAPRSQRLARALSERLLDILAAARSRRRTGARTEPVEHLLDRSG